MKRRYTIVIDGKRYTTYSVRRFWRKARSIKWADLKKKVYLKVLYAKGFQNEGDYTNEEDFLLALNAFLEE